jgi:hypothetical protein
MNFLCVFLLFLGSTGSETSFHQGTEWEIQPSLKFDVLCLLNTLTGDPYYLAYYQSEYDKFKPRLTASATNALRELKRKIKEESRSIISAFLCLYFSAGDGETLDDLLDTVRNSSQMESNLRQIPFFRQEGW